MANQSISSPVNNPYDAHRYYQQMRSQMPAASLEFGKRKMMSWLVPEVGLVQMYINPQSVKISERKTIKPERTKGGFVVQYWGEELTSININGHTGSSGYDGINILRNIYRGEQNAFDIIALEKAAELQNEDDNFIRDLIPGLGQVEDVISGLTDKSQNTGLIQPSPTLAYYACGIEMYWMGEVYRGFFTSFSVDESVDRLGIFTYSMEFTATQKRGIRTNNFPWQHVANKGPSDHKLIPYTYQNSVLTASNSAINVF